MIEDVFMWLGRLLYSTEPMDCRVIASEICDMPPSFSSFCRHADSVR